VNFPNEDIFLRPLKNLWIYNTFIKDNFKTNGFEKKIDFPSVFFNVVFCQVVSHI